MLKKVEKELREFPIAQTFGVDAPEDLTVPGYAAPDDFVPRTDLDYIFRKEHLRVLLAWLQTGREEGLIITGPTGSGKSSLVLQVAARLNLPVQVAVGNPRMEKADLVGAHALIDGMTLFSDGPLTAAMRRGDLFVLEEWDVVDPAVMTSLNLVLEGRALVIEENGGEVVRPAPGFGVVLTGNTAGNGDLSGIYRGTQHQNAAALDRCWVMRVDYPDRDDELAVLSRVVPQLGEDILGKLVDIAGEVRKLFVGDDNEGEQIELTMSTRTLVRWAKLMVAFRRAESPATYALDLALANRAEPATREALHKLVHAHFGDPE